MREILDPSKMPRIADCGGAPVHLVRRSIIDFYCCNKTAGTDHDLLVTGFAWDADRQAGRVRYTGGRHGALGKDPRDKGDDPEPLGQSVTSLFAKMGYVRSKRMDHATGDVARIPMNWAQALRESFPRFAECRFEIPEGWCDLAVAFANSISRLPETVARERLSVERVDLRRDGLVLDSSIRDQQLEMWAAAFAHASLSVCVSCGRPGRVVKSFPVDVRCEEHEL